MMDETDQRLIAELRRDGRAALSELAERLGLSRATVRARMERLAARGEIAGFTVLTRSDGKSRIIGSSDIYPGSFHFNLIAGKNYHLKLNKLPPKRIEFARNEQAGKPVRISLDYPTSSFTLKLWGTDPVAKAANLAALSTGGTKYYYDVAKKRLHLRFVSNDGLWKGYVLQRP